jgi:tetratricopeptide (TPR) repeat protein
VAADRVCLLFTILGSAGVGKSRLVNEFLAGLDEDVRLLRGRCLSYGQGITFWPIREMVHQAAGVGDQDSAAEVRDRIAALVDPSAPEAERIVEGVTDLVGLGDGGVERQDAFLAARHLFEGLAEDRPLVLLFDDVHWAEASLLDLIEHMADWSRDAPILLLCVGRQELLELRPAWGGGKLAATTIQLEPLTAAESDELLAGLLGEAELEPDVRRRIADAADGNPLFVEELLGMLIDDGSLVRRDGRWVAARDLRLLTVPPTIQALLAARLDRLDRTERSVIECGSVEGKVFHASAVAALVPDPMRAAVPSNLLALMRKELLRPDRTAFSGDEAYRFRHLLIRDAAYEAMPKQARAEMHVRFADWLEVAAGERRAEYEEILGHHLDQAIRYRRELAIGDTDADELASRAADHLGQAGMRAADRGDLNAARPLLERALDLTNEGPMRPRLLEHLADVRWGQSDPLAAKAHLEQAIAGYRSRGDAAGAARAEVLLLGVRSSLESLEMTDVLPRARELAVELESLGDLKGWASAMELVGSHLFFIARTTEAIEVISDALERAPQHSRERTLLSHWLAASYYWGSTPVAEALRGAEQIVRENAGRRSVEAGATRVIGALKAMLGDFEGARADIASADLFAIEAGYDLIAESSGAHFLAPAELLAGEPQAALDAALPSYEAMTASGDRAFSSTAAGYVAAAYAELGRWDEAERYARITIDTAATSDAESQALGRRVLAVVLAHRGDFAEAERVARESVAIRDAGEYLDGAGHSYAALGEVLRLAGRDAEAAEAQRQALDRFERKGNLIMVERTRRILTDRR